MIVHIDKTLPHFDSYPVERTRGLYNVGVEDGSRFTLDVELPIDSDVVVESDSPTAWQIGVVVGPSGSGKTSIAQALHDSGWHEYHGLWPDVPIIEALTEKDDYAKATAALAAVGLGSVPSWLRPYRVLSNGEQFRANMAALLLDTSGAEGAMLKSDASIYLDEFTSVLDRQVAKVGAGAFAKAWRRKSGRRIILITPHYDILDWVEPDWWIDTAEGADAWADQRGVVTARQGSFQEAHHGTRYPGDRVGTVAC